MSFGNFNSRKYPVRQWAIVGYPNDGKSTFAAAMLGPLLVVDADQRFSEVAHLAENAVPLSNTGWQNIDTNEIKRILDENMRQAKVGTIVVDSLTAIIEPLITQTLVDNDAGYNKNFAAGFKKKAMAMRQLQNAVSMWGVDALWIYHYRDGGNNKGANVTTTSIPRTELARLMRSLNLHLKIVRDGDKRGIEVMWARRGRSGMTIWDETGTFEGMPEKIESAVYDGLTAEDMEALASAIPERFNSPEEAIAWGEDMGVFKALQHSRNAYDKLKRESEPGTAQEMWDIWIAYVLERKARAEAEEDAEPETD